MFQKIIVFVGAGLGYCVILGLLSSIAQYFQARAAYYKRLTKERARHE